MSIDRTDRTVVTRDLPADSNVGDPVRDRSRSLVLGIAVASLRTVAMVVLASLAILVVLPAALAAQAAIGI